MEFLHIYAIKDSERTINIMEGDAGFSVLGEKTAEYLGVSKNYFETLLDLKEAVNVELVHKKSIELHD